MTKGFIMARKRTNFGMIFALAVGGWYLWKQYQAKQALLAAPPQAATVGNQVTSAQNVTGA